jgi:hypothetical protein
VIAKTTEDVKHMIKRRSAGSSPAITKELEKVTA